MNCPFCHYPVTSPADAVKVGDQWAHAPCVEHDALRQTRPFRERVTLDDRGPEPGQPLKERKIRRIDRELSE